MIKEIIHDTISEKSEIEKQRKGYCTMKIYEKIFARLEELHMSQIELSRRTGIATSTISDWRKKKINPQADKLVSICKALDMSLAELLCDEEVVERTIEPDFMVDGQNIIELLRTSDFETKRRILRYFELIEICREINRENSSQKIKRNVSVIQDIDGNNIVNMDFIRRLTARELLLTDGKRIPISQSRYGEIKNSYFTYMTHI